MRRAAEAEEAILLRIGVLAQRDDPRDPGSGQAMRDIGLQVELVMIGPRPVGEEALILRRLFGEAAQETGIDLIAGARDARADRGGDALAAGAKASIASSVASVMPPSAPFHPAWAAPTTPASASANKTGAQSAVRIPSNRPGRFVTSASPCGRTSSSGGVSIVTASAEWIW